MYAGLGSSLLVSKVSLLIHFFVQGIFPYVGVKMAAFDVLKTFIKLDRSDPYFTLKNMTMGAIAGGLSIFATYPSDLIRRRMQMRGQDGIPNYSNFFDCGYKIAQADGVKGLFKGLVACQLKVVPAMAIMFMCNEELKKVIKI
jgi:solute carrier family 25 phosphate transporter 23/24/25/41